MKKIEKYDLENGLLKINLEIERKLKDASNPVIVLVAWWTASWKTSRVAEKIKNSFPKSQILSMDNYYRWREYYKKHKLNFDQPEALDLDLFFEHLEKLKFGKKVKIPEYNFKTWQPIFDKITIKPTKLIIIEWLFALNKKIEVLWDLKIFVDLWVQSQILRRLFRDVERTGDKPKNILKYFLDVVYKMHKKYIEPTKKNADIILLNDYIPNLEAKNAKIEDTRLRYKVWFKNPKETLSELIYKLGWTYVWKTEQSDYFFDPKWNYSKTWELMIIRKFGFSRYFFMYFWPDDKKTLYDDRYSMKFFTDYETLKNFKKLYPKNIIEISRIRRSFFIWWVLVCLDEIENWEKYLVFKFDNKKSREIILEILEKLSINPKSVEKKSYFELFNK